MYKELRLMEKFNLEDNRGALQKLLQRKEMAEV
jgi:hypothetical protein